MFAGHPEGWAKFDSKVKFIMILADKETFHRDNKRRILHIFQWFARATIRVQVLQHNVNTDLFGRGSLGRDFNQPRAEHNSWSQTLHKKSKETTFMAFKSQLLELDVSVCYYLVNRRKRPGFTFFDVIYKVEEENNKKLFFIMLSWFYRCLWTGANFILFETHGNWH